MVLRYNPFGLEFKPFLCSSKFVCKLVMNTLQASDVLCRVISLVQLRQAEVDIERVLKTQMVLTALLMLPVIYYLAVP